MLRIVAVSSGSPYARPRPPSRVARVARGDPDADVALKSLQLLSSWTSPLSFPLPSYISKLEPLKAQSTPHSTRNAAMQQGAGSHRAPPIASTVAPLPPE